MTVTHHSYAPTIHHKLLFGAPRKGGHWRLLGLYEPRENLTESIDRFKQRDWLIEIIVSSEDPKAVVQALHKRAVALHAAGLGPDRRPPVQMAPGPEPARLGLRPVPAFRKGRVRSRKSSKKPKEQTA